MLPIPNSIWFNTWIMNWSFIKTQTIAANYTWGIWNMQCYYILTEYQLKLFLLSRYDIVKTCQWSFIKFSWLFHYRKVLKSCLKAGGHHTSSLVLEVKRSKILQILIESNYFNYILNFIFMVFLMQKQIHTINI